MLVAQIRRLKGRKIRNNSNTKFKNKKVNDTRKWHLRKKKKKKLLATNIGFIYFNKATYAPLIL